MEKKYSGAVEVSKQSEWHLTSGEAEGELVDLMYDAIEKAKLELEQQGKRVVGTMSYNVNVREKFEGEATYFQAYSNVEINWIYEFQYWDASDKEKRELVPAIETYVIVEEELLNRFRKKFRGKYNQLSLASVDFIDSSIVVNTDDYIEMPVDISSKTTEIENCTKDPKEKSFEIKIEESWTDDVQFTKKVTTTSNIDMKAGMAIKGVNLSLSGQKSWTTDITSKKTEVYKKVETKTTKYIERVNPWSTLTVESFTGIRSRKYKIRGTAIFGGLVTLRYKERKCEEVKIGVKISWNCKDHWKSYQVKISDVLSIEERTFDIEGYLLSSTDTVEKTKFKEIDASCGNAPIDESIGLMDLPEELELIKDKLINPGRGEYDFEIKEKQIFEKTRIKI